MISVKILNHPKDILRKPKKNINVIVSIYNGAEYIEECLDSIQAQTFKPKRILLGVDGCKDSMNRINEIRHKYDNLYVYYSQDNNGVYHMFNALIDLVPDNEWIQFFGADDIMEVNMLEKMQENDRYAISKHVGVLFIKKSHLKLVGGFRDWRCAADADMIMRLRLTLKYKEISMPILFKRRIHDKQLTKIYPNDSGLRKQYIEITNINYTSDNPITYITPIKSKIEAV